jgi:hypothetical protein
VFSRTSNVSFSKKLASHRFVQIYNLWFRLSHRRVKCRRQESRIDQSARGRSARRVSLLLQFFIKCWNYERSLVFHVQIVSLSLISPRSIEVSKRRDLVTVRPRIRWPLAQSALTLRSIEKTSRCGDRSINNEDEKMSRAKESPVAPDPTKCPNPRNSIRRRSEQFSSTFWRTK